MRTHILTLTGGLGAPRAFPAGLFLGSQGSQDKPPGKDRSKRTKTLYGARRGQRRAERRMGQLLKVMPKNPGVRHLGGCTVQPPEDLPLLADYGIEKTLSHRCQQVAAVPEGLGTCLESVKRLCGSDPEALDLIDQATRQPLGTNQHDEGVNIVNTLRPEGNSAAAALRRLRKDAPALHARVLAGITPFIPYSIRA